MAVFLKKVFSLTFEILQTVVLAGAAFAVIYITTAQLHEVQGSSMDNNFHDKEYILTEKISYKFRDPKRGEVIIFRAPDKPDKDYIKRVIGLSGEKLQIIGGTIYINGKMLNETYEPINLINSGGNFLREGQIFTIPPESFFVMGDNRAHSSDSRKFGTVSKGAIIGRAFFRFWPIGRIGLIKTPKY